MKKSRSLKIHTRYRLLRKGLRRAENAFEGLLFKVI